jgi:hypothetical protein
MKKATMVILGTMAAVLLAACDFAMPASVKVQGSPGVHLPLGNPFSGDNADLSPANLLSMNKIEEFLGGGSMPVSLYKYEDPTAPTILTYLIRYPLADMSYDLSSYMQNDVKIPAIPQELIAASNAPGVSFPMPQPIERTVPLGSMADLVTSVSYTKIGIRIPGNYKDKLKVSISTFGITDNQGTIAGDYTEFVKTSVSATAWSPEEITISITVLAPLSGTIAPEFVLEWTTAKVKAGTNGNLTGNIPLNFASLNDVFAGIQFKDDAVEAYMYVSGLPNSSNNTLALTAKKGSADSSDVQSATALSDAALPQLVSGETYIGSIPADSLTSIDNIDLTGTFNDAIGETVALGYTVSMGNELEIQNGEKTGKVSAELLIKLSLDLKIESGTSPSSWVANSSDYTKLSIDGLPTLTDDVFGRSGPNDKIMGMLDGLKDVKIILGSFNNSLIGNVYIAVNPNNATNGVDSTPLPANGGGGAINLH